MCNVSAIILSYGRKDGMTITYNSLRQSGFTGEIYILVDDKDSRLPDYRAVYGEKNVLVFSKSEVAVYCDLGDNDTEQLNCAMIARNAVYRFAENINTEFLLICDDDICEFQCRYTNEDENILKSLKVRNLDEWLDILSTFLDDARVYGVGFDTAGQLIGGINAGEIRQFQRPRVAQCYLIKRGKPIIMPGRSQEDITASVLYNQRGKVCVSFGCVRIVTHAVESLKGGMTEAYSLMGDIRKNIYPVMYNPGVCRIMSLRNAGFGRERTHIKVRHGYLPKFIPEDYDRSE